MNFSQRRAADLFLTHHGLVIRSAFQAAPIPDMVDDIVQDTFGEFVTHAARFNLEGDVRPLLCQITRNVALRYWKKRQRERSEVLREIGERYRLLGERQSELHSEAETDWYKQDISLLEFCINKLTTRSRMVIDLFYYQKKSLAEIGKTCDLTPNALSQFLFRIRLRLRSCIETLSKKSGP